MKRCLGPKVLLDPPAKFSRLFGIVVNPGDDQMRDLKPHALALKDLKRAQNILQVPEGHLRIKAVAESLDVDVGRIKIRTKPAQGFFVDKAG
jgi:hypothetical protein